jgi:hypothetical protein
VLSLPSISDCPAVPAAAFDPMDRRRAEVELQNAIELIRRGRKLQARIYVFRALEILQ